MIKAVNRNRTFLIGRNTTAYLEIITPPKEKKLTVGVQENQTLHSQTILMAPYMKIIPSICSPVILTLKQSKYTVYRQPTML